MKISLVEYDAGNLPSVERALARQNVECVRASTPEAIQSAQALILPGVGHFGQLMRTLDARGLDAPLRDAIAQGRPLLGICLGLQALFKTSDESPGNPGLSVFAGKVTALPSTAKLPHMGWNQLQQVRESALFEGVPAGSYFYFAHTYAALDAGDATVALCDHAALFVAALAMNNLFAVQFHPEKSGDSGARVLANFVAPGGFAFMTLARRIIPCLDTDGQRVVKGVQFMNLRDAGDPAALAARYNQEGADELVVLDITASRDRRGTFVETIRRVAAELAIPLTAGGGITSVDQGRAVLRAGADKITVNTAALRRPFLLTELAAEFGSQAVVLAIDAKRVGNQWQAFVRGGRDSTGQDAVRWATEGVSLGAGEILVTSMDRDGTRKGFDLPLTAAISRAVSVPVIASGGADSPPDFVDVFVEGCADAALAASIFHDSIQGLGDLKRFLASKGVPVRLN